MTPPVSSPRKLHTAGERREDVLRAAVAEFSRRGLYGTPTTDIARAAGISQAYLFRLFPTKEELFVACVERVLDNLRLEFERAGRQHAGDPEAALSAIGDRYDELLRDSDLLLCQLHAYAACQEPAVREAVRVGFQRLVETIQDISGAPDDEVQRFFAMGMLVNVLAATGAHELDEPWAQALMAGKDC